MTVTKMVVPMAPPELLAGQMRALLVAEMITCTWRVAWQCFAQEERAGNGSNPDGLFDKTVAYLTEITSASAAGGSQQADGPLAPA
jgi:hypothetical protein